MDCSTIWKQTLYGGDYISVALLKFLCPNFVWSSVILSVSSLQTVWATLLIVQVTSRWEMGDSATKPCCTWLSVCIITLKVGVKWLGLYRSLRCIR